MELSLWFKCVGSGGRMRGMDSGEDARGSMNRGRYFCDTTTCFRCGEAGHGVRECQNMSGSACELCADPGHIRLHCPCRFCIRCRRAGHLSNACRDKKEQGRGRMCAACSGRHSAADCPRMWRRYRLLDGGRGEVRKACPICLSRTHFLDDCEAERQQTSIFSSSFLRIAGRRP